MDLYTRLEKIISPIVLNHGLELVQILYSGQTRAKLQVMIERADRTNVTIDDCVKVSRELSIILDVEDPLPSSYKLEVTSPGLDRPLTKKNDYQRFLGENIKLQLFQVQNGQKNFLGTIINTHDDFIELKLKDTNEVLKFIYDEIKKANLDPKY